MRILDPLFLITLSDLFINLSAGWFGAAAIIPLASKRITLRWKLLPIHIGFGIVSLLLSYLLKKAGGL